MIMKEMKVGLQLFSVREDLKKDMEATLAKVKEIGYDYVEAAGFLGDGPKEFRAMLDQYDLKAISIHRGPEPFLKDGQASIEELKEIGVECCAIPWYPVEKLKGTDAWEETVKTFIAYGEALKENGIQLMYHNHDFEFHKFEGKFLLDWLYETISTDLLMPQIDTCWVRYAGYDPCGYIEKYNGKMKTLHLKDFVCKNLSGGPVYDLIGDKGDAARTASREDNGFEFMPVGYGIQDFPAILETAGKAGIEYLIVEQDESKGRPALEAAKMSRDYLKSLGY